MTELEKQVYRVVQVWGQLCADARNDGPWSELRHGPYLAEELDALSFLCVPLNEEELEELW